METANARASFSTVTIDAVVSPRSISPMYERLRPAY